MRVCSRWGVNLGVLTQFVVSKSDLNLACMLADLQPFGSEGVYSWTAGDSGFG